MTFPHFGTRICQLVSTHAMNFFIWYSHLQFCSVLKKIDLQFAEKNRDSPNFVNITIWRALIRLVSRTVGIVRPFDASQIQIDSVENVQVQPGNQKTK